jgi:hypothetical protein
LTKIVVAISHKWQLTVILHLAVKTNKRYKVQILKYWRVLATVIIVAIAALVNNIVSGIDGTVSGAIAVNQMNGGDAGYIAAHVAATSSSYSDIIIALITIALMIVIWTPVVKQWFNPSK